MFDTHTHLNLPELQTIYKKVVKDARETGVNYFVIPSTNESNFNSALKIASYFENVYLAAGIHPTEDLEQIDIDKFFFNLKEVLEDTNKVIAIGETGLDYYHFKTGSSTQIKFLQKHIHEAIKLSFPVIIHNRQAEDDIISVLSDDWSDSLSHQIVFHCCPVSSKLLDFALKKNIYIGVDGDITYDSDKTNFIKEVPLDFIVLETDSPYLTPEPLRSKKVFPNTPANLKYIASFVAKIKKTNGNEVIRKTTANAKRLFNLTK